ncbi:MAG: 4Fe-4S cluster-binding domain-containing protein, partial [Firmicutes bacterium]|nr:4Fe-4S cluster-binding domain-containing protein [Bacillota bacterium]
MVHTFAMNDNYIALDVNSGSIYLVEEIVYSILKDFPNKFPSYEEVFNQKGSQYQKSEIDEAYREIESLNAEKRLYSPEIDWDQLLKKSYQVKDLKALCLHVAHDCNLQCEYCFASNGDYHLGQSLMTADTAIKAIDFLVRNSERQNLEIDFFGGEPMLNFQVVKAAVSYGREVERRSGKKLHFTITTNGTLLDEPTIDYLNQNIDNVVISIDGRKETHDAIRFYRGGKGSYDRIVPLAQELVRNRGSKEYYIRGTFTSANLDFASDVLHLAGLGFNEISIEPAIGHIGRYTIKREHLPEILREYESLAQ